MQEIIALDTAADKVVLQPLETLTHFGVVQDSDSTTAYVTEDEAGKMVLTSYNQDLVDSDLEEEADAEDDTPRGKQRHSLCSVGACGAGATRLYKLGRLCTGCLPRNRGLAALMSRGELQLRLGYGSPI